MALLQKESHSCSEDRDDVTWTKDSVVLCKGAVSSSIMTPVWVPLLWNFPPLQLNPLTLTLEDSRHGQSSRPATCVPQPNNLQTDLRHFKLKSTLKFRLHIWNSSRVLSLPLGNLHRVKERGNGSCFLLWEYNKNCLNAQLWSENTLQCVEI